MLRNSVDNSEPGRGSGQRNPGTVLPSIHKHKSWTKLSLYEHVHLSREKTHASHQLLGLKNGAFSGKLLPAVNYLINETKCLLCLGHLPPQSLDSQVLWKHTPPTFPTHPPGEGFYLLWSWWGDAKCRKEWRHTCHGQPTKGAIKALNAHRQLYEVKKIH